MVGTGACHGLRAGLALILQPTPAETGLCVVVLSIPVSSSVTHNHHKTCDLKEEDCCRNSWWNQSAAMLQQDHMATELTLLPQLSVTASRHSKQSKYLTVSKTSWLRARSAECSSGLLPWAALELCTAFVRTDASQTTTSPHHKSSARKQRVFAVNGECCRLTYNCQA